MQTRSFHIVILCLNIAEEFNNYMQQDAHEFLNFLINRINEIILRKYGEKILSPKNFRFLIDF